MTGRKRADDPRRGSGRRRGAQRDGAQRDGGRQGAPAGQRDGGQRRAPPRKWKGIRTSLVARPAAAVPEVGPGGEPDARVRLNKYLALAGVASRRGADELIVAGVVRVNGQIVRDLGVKVDPLADLVEVKGEKLAREKPVYVLLNKPAGVVCTNARNEKRVRAVDLTSHIRGRLFSVGRLDEDSEGLLLMTNDGEFANLMTHPRYGIPKVYGVLVKGRMEEDDVQKARGGVWLAEGKTGDFRVQIKRRSREKTYLLVTIREGRNREVRRLFAKLGFPVTQLKRLRIGPLTLHGLGRGKCRFVTAREVQDLVREAKEGREAT
jgi:pseudouridine synthase